MLRNLMIDAITERAERPVQVSNKNVLHVTLGVYVRRWLRKAEMRRQLHALDDRMLSDIGVARCDIEKIVTQAVGREFPHVKPVLAPMAKALKAAWLTWRAAAEQRATARSLAHLDDHLLHDLGLRRDAMTALNGGYTKRRGLAISMLGAVKSAFQAWRDYSRTARTLASLDDRTLRDIGIARSDIARIAARVAHGHVANDDRAPRVA